MSGLMMPPFQSAAFTANPGGWWAITTPNCLGLGNAGVDELLTIGSIPLIPGLLADVTYGWVDNGASHVVSNYPFDYAGVCIGQDSSPALNFGTCAGKVFTDNNVYMAIGGASVLAYRSPVLNAQVLYPNCEAIFTLGPLVAGHYDLSCRMINTDAGIDDTETFPSMFAVTDLICKLYMNVPCSPNAGGNPSYMQINSINIPGLPPLAGGGPTFVWPFGMQG